MAIQISSPSEITSFGVALWPLIWISFSSNSLTKDLRGYRVSSTAPSVTSVFSLHVASISAAVTVHKISSGRCVFRAISISFLRVHCLVAYSLVASLVEPLGHVY